MEGRDTESEGRVRHFTRFPPSQTVTRVSRTEYFLFSVSEVPIRLDPNLEPRNVFSV